MSDTNNAPEASGGGPPILTEESRFNFTCRKGLDCFTTCCHGMQIILPPYDILRLARRLELGTEEFLDRYTRFSIHEPTLLPMVILNMKDDKEESCPFVTAEGCTVYEDRPAICRYYPVGLASLTLKDMTDEKRESEERHHHFLIREPHCLGHGEPREWDVAGWRKDQDVLAYDEANADWNLIFLRRHLPKRPRIDHRQQRLFYLASYNLDEFRRFVFESAFLDKFEVDPATVEEMRGDDEALLRFGLRYCKYFLMIEKNMVPREGVVPPPPPAAGDSK